MQADDEYLIDNVGKEVRVHKSKLE